MVRSTCIIRLLVQLPRESRCTLRRVYIAADLPRRGGGAVSDKLYLLAETRSALARRPRPRPRLRLPSSRVYFRAVGSKKRAEEAFEGGEHSWRAR